MYFSRKHIILFILFLFVIAILFFIGKQYYQPTYKGRGYCSTSNEYILPKMYDDFISPEETKHILQLANPLFRESRLVSGFSENIRKSQTAWLSPSDPIIKQIIERVCTVAKIPFENSEKIFSPK